jgi:hypothetical protein
VSKDTIEAGDQLSVLEDGGMTDEQHNENWSVIVVI